MLERMEGLPAGIDGLTARGKVSKQDYERVFAQLIAEARQAGRRIRLVYHFGPAFDGFTPGGAWEDAKRGLRSMHLFEGCAIVSDIPWIRSLSRVMGFLMSCPVRVFGHHDLDSAVAWLKSLPEHAGVSHRLIPESEVIVVEVEEPLRAQDFEALSATADNWRQTHGDLRGLVIHARKFPGWEDIGSLARHVRFVRDHHRQVHRIALATDAKLATVAPRLADRLLETEVERFDYDDLDAAIAWASTPR